MTIAEKEFTGYLGFFIPDRIKNVTEKYECVKEGNILPKYTFKDGSYIETYGGELISINGKTEMEVID